MPANGPGIASVNARNSAQTPVVFGPSGPVLAATFAPGASFMRFSIKIGPDGRNLTAPHRLTDRAMLATSAVEAEGGGRRRPARLFDLTYVHAFDGRHGCTDERDVRRRVRFPAVRHRSEKGRVGLDKEPADGAESGRLANIAGVLERDDPAEGQPNPEIEADRAPRVRRR